ncbi:hypothetical protein Pint_33923 [Pistacia integerrima]|uniref:Uncharacterized protein n=1 Tax=Pistacia integerrima TaxID=434235 RepID=A0ACC0X5W9_9ROSI|nr:hypothetical protein Pint_33923 [Pistacia integerrima]
MLVGHLPSLFFKDDLVQIRKVYRLLVGLHVTDDYPPDSPHDGLTAMSKVLLWCRGELHVFEFVYTNSLKNSKEKKEGGSKVNRPSLHGLLGILSKIDN